MRPRTRTRNHLGVAFAIALVALTAYTSRPTVAYAQDPDRIADSPQHVQDRLQMLRQEFKERRQELREAAEHARHARHAHGKKAEQYGQDIDWMPSNLTGGNVHLPAGINSANAVPSNVLVNNKTGDGAGAGQAEESIVFLGQNGICAFNDGQGFNEATTSGGYNVQELAYTNNAGATWNGDLTPPNTGSITNYSSDPVVAVNEKSGEFYYCGLTGNGSTQNGVAVARGHFAAGTFVWDGSSIVAAVTSSSFACDKEWMAVDSLTGNVYVTYTLFTTTGDNIWFSRSTDGGVTWSAAIQVSGSWENGYCSGSRPVVGPSGEVYVTYNSIGPVDADSVKVAKSVNAGVSFTPAVVAATVMDNYDTGAPGFNRARAVTFPSIAVDRSTGCNRGRVYVAIQNSIDLYADTFPATTNAGLSKSEVENNNNYANSTPFTPGQNLHGAISSTTDTDIWKFNAVQGSTYLFWADSVRTSSFKYSLRIYCPNDTTVVSRLALSGDGSTSDPTNTHALIAWTAPTTNTYYLRVVEVASTGGYRIRTTVHTPNIADRGRDARDATVYSSADGQTGWTGPVIMNDDAPLYDNWLPEVAVAADGKAYSMWFDWRDTPASCFGGSNIYVSRSVDAGATWAPNQAATSSPTNNWTQVASNIAPNEGDYNGMWAGDAVGLAWADGRLGDADVNAARITTGYALSGCPAITDVYAGATYNNTATINNNNSMFGDTYNYTVSVNVNWPGYPATGTVAVASLGSGTVPVTLVVPDSAQDGEVVTVCVQTSLCGALVQSCCFPVTVHVLSTPTLASLSSSTAEPGRVSLSWMVDSHNAVNVYRSTDGTSWSSLGSVVPTATGYVNVLDANVEGGSRYEYRLGLATKGGEVFAGQTWVSVPVSAEFALSRVYPSPAKSGFSVSFSLPNGNPATLDVIDLAGRRVISRQVGTMGAGRHTLSLESESGRLPIGIYGVRLTQGSHVASSKVTVVR